MKQCRKCHIEKSKKDFSVRNKKKGWLSSWCRMCVAQYQKQHRIENSEKYQAWQKKADEKFRKTIKYRIGLESQRNRRRKYALEHYYSNKHIYRASDARRRAQKLNATLNGFDKELKEIYKNCPQGYHVDHIIPLQHPDVCGLHVPWNLQYLRAEENLRKNNRLEVV